MRSVRIPYFRIWYSSLFILLFILTVILTLIPPTNLVYQSIAGDTISNIFSVGGVYLLTAVIWAFIWSSRIYTNRLVLREIPKSYIPVDYGEVPRKVYKMVKRQWERSALVAWDSRPRDVRKEMEDGGVRRTSGHFRRRIRIAETTVIPPETALAVWGDIAHPGWSPPTSEDLPNLQYWQVIQELPNLIEAKAVSLAPPDPAFLEEGLTAQNANTIPDARIVALLQRPQTMGLRDYLSRLDALDLINPSDLAPTFLSQYERARFSSTLPTEQQFRQLMATFASILSGMTTLDPATTNEALDNLDDSSSSIITPSIRSTFSAIHHSVPDSSSSDAASIFNPRLRLRPSTYQRTSSIGTVLTAPSRMSHPHTVQRTPSPASSRSHGSFARTKTNMSAASSPSASLRSARSVVRLTPEPREPGASPYEIDIPGG